MAVESRDGVGGGGAAEEERPPLRRQLAYGERASTVAGPGQDAIALVEQRSRNPDGDLRVAAVILDH